MFSFLRKASGTDGSGTGTVKILRLRNTAFKSFTSTVPLTRYRIALSPLSFF